MATKKYPSRSKIKSRARVASKAPLKKESSTKKSVAKPRSGAKKSSTKPARKLSPGSKVKWKSSQGTIHGMVKKKVTSPMKIKRHAVSATPENPQYLVESNNTGAQAAHQADALQPE